MADISQDHICFTCKKPKVTPWACAICERAGISVEVCSARCMRVHENDGRHRKELRMQQAQAIGLTAPPRRGNRVQVRIVRKQRAGGAGTPPAKPSRE